MHIMSWTEGQHDPHHNPPPPQRSSLMCVVVRFGSGALEKAVEEERQRLHLEVERLQRLLGQNKRFADQELRAMRREAEAASQERDRLEAIVKLKEKASRLQALQIKILKRTLRDLVSGHIPLAQARAVMSHFTDEAEPAPSPAPTPTPAQPGPPPPHRPREGSRSRGATPLSSKRAYRKPVPVPVAAVARAPEAGEHDDLDLDITGFLEREIEKELQLEKEQAAAGGAGAAQAQAPMEPAREAAVVQPAPLPPSASDPALSKPKSNQGSAASIARPEGPQGEKARSASSLSSGASGGKKPDVDDRDHGAKPAVQEAVPVIVAEGAGAVVPPAKATALPESRGSEAQSAKSGLYDEDFEEE
jgi:hypothetical protein